MINPIATWAFALSFVGAIFAFGIRIGTLTERVDNQTKQIVVIEKKLDMIAIDFAGTRVEIMRILGNERTQPR